MRTHLAAVATLALIQLAIHPSAAAPEQAPAERAAGQEGVQRPEEALSVYRPLPDIALRVAGGGESSLSGFWEERPLVLTLVFTRCYGVCNPFLRAIRSVSDAVGGAGQDYEVLVLSFDARDTEEEMAMFAEAVGAAERPGWHFGVAVPGEVARLADAVGFAYQWNEETQQFDHPATLVGAVDGQVLRVVTGGAVSQARFREMLSELRGDFVPIYPTEADRRFRCFEFTAEGVARPSWGLLILVYPAIATLLLAMLVFSVAGRRRERRDRNPNR